MHIHLCPLRYLRFHPEEREGIPNLWPQPRKGAPPRELEEELGESPIWQTKLTRKPPPPWSGHFLFQRGQPARAGNDHTNTGPFPLVIYTRHLVPNRSSLADKCVFEPQKVEAWGTKDGSAHVISWMDWLFPTSKKESKSVSPSVVSDSLRFHGL